MKYKHKKTGDIVELSATGNRYYGRTSSFGIIRMPIVFVEDSDDWELITEPKKDYEILEYYTPQMYWHMEQDAPNFIKKVKRLSDGVVFTIGDKVSLFARNDYNEIKTLTLLSDKFVGDTISINGYVNGLCSYKKKKQPLFVTEDGKDLMNRTDEVFVIVKGEFSLMHQYNGRTLGVFLNGWYTTNSLEDDKRVLELIKEHYLLFSTKEAAEEYIVRMKPCLTLNEVMNQASVYMVNNTSYNSFRDMMSQLVKSKIGKL